jgi:hypothetical protein
MVNIQFGSLFRVRRKIVRFRHIRLTADFQTRHSVLSWRHPASAYVFSGVSYCHVAIFMTLLLFSSCGICSSVRPAVRRFKSIQSSFWRISCFAHSAVCLPRPCAHYTDQSSNDVCKPTVLSSVDSATAYISDIQSAQYANRTLLEVPRDKARR